MLVLLLLILGVSERIKFLLPFSPHIYFYIDQPKEQSPFFTYEQKIKLVFNAFSPF